MAGAATPPTKPKPPTKPELQRELTKQAKGVQTSGSAAARNPKELPFTGFPAWAIALLGAALLATGLGLRKVSA